MKTILRGLLIASLLGAGAISAIIGRSESQQHSLVFAMQVASGAQKLYEAGQYEIARKALEEQLEATPDSLIVQRELAMQLAATGQVEAAVQHLEKVLDLDSDDAAAAAVLGRMLLKLGENGMHHLALARTLLKQQHPEEALTSARNAVRLAPGVAEAHILLALASRSVEDEPAARAALEDALAIDPDNVEASNALAEGFDLQPND